MVSDALNRPRSIKTAPGHVILPLSASFLTRSVKYVIGSSVERLQRSQTDNLKDGYYFQDRTSVVCIPLSPRSSTGWEESILVDNYQSLLTSQI